MNELVSELARERVTYIDSNNSMCIVIPMYILFFRPLLNLSFEKLRLLVPPLPILLRLLWSGGGLEWDEY